MPDIRIVWKVVSVHYGLFLPAIVCVDVKYLMGEVTRPYFLGSVIYAFDTLANAAGFVHRETYPRNGNIAILKCEAQIARRWKRAIFCNSIVQSDMRAFWESRSARRVMTSFFAPPGTLMCLWVRPVEVYCRSDGTLLADDPRAWVRTG